MTPAAVAVRYLRWLADRIEQTGQRMIAADTRRVADDLEQFEQLRAAFHTIDGCRRCGGPIVNAHTGRPRRYCRECRPPETRRKLHATEG